MSPCRRCGRHHGVAPYAGAWIEITLPDNPAWTLGSLPTRERGLKCVKCKGEYPWNKVAPYAGAWIEISGYTPPVTVTLVAPYAGAWIEMEIVTW